MITTGYPRNVEDMRRTELIDLLNDETCSDLADFPGKILACAIGVNLLGTPIVCGGVMSHTNTGENKCYKYFQGGWQEFASMKTKRGYPAGIIYKNKLHVFGGWLKKNVILRSSEIIGLDGVVTDGPELPFEVQRHAITAVDTTTSIISGGKRNGWVTTRETWYYNHETKKFTRGPDLLESRFGHKSATIIDKVTNAKIPIVAGGYQMESTELLIDEVWRKGRN